MFDSHNFEKTFEDRMIAWVAKGSGLEECAIFRANDNHAALDGEPYATILPMNVSPTGHPYRHEERFLRDGEWFYQRYLTQTYTVPVDINFYREDSLNRALNLETWSYGEEATILAQGYGFGVIRRGQATRLDALDPNEYQEKRTRIQMTFQLTRYMEQTEIPAMTPGPVFLGGDEITITNKQ